MSDLSRLLDELEQARAKAVPGTWETAAEQRQVIFHAGSDRWVAEASDMGDAALIVAAVNAVPTLVAALRRVEATLQAAQEWVRDELITDNGFAEQCARAVIDDVRAALNGGDQ
jgi:hypothetical protein